MALVWTLLAYAANRRLNRFTLLVGTILLIATNVPGAVVEVTSLPPPLSNAPAPPPSAKFLFVVETSAAMKRFEHDGRQVVFDLVYSGISNQMHTADTYGVWTFSEQVSAGVYPMQVWSGDKSLEQASKIGVFLKGDHYRGKPRADLAIAKALGVVKAVKDVNVVLVTSGESSLGTSELEMKLRETYQRKAEQARQQKVPLVLTFCTTDGEIAMASVTLAGERIQLREDLLAKARQPVKKPDPTPKAVVQAPAPVVPHVRPQPIIMIGQPKTPPPVASIPASTPVLPVFSESTNREPSAVAAANPPVAEPKQASPSIVQSSNAPQVVTMKPSTTPITETKPAIPTTSFQSEKKTFASTPVAQPQPAAAKVAEEESSKPKRLPELIPATMKVAAREPGEPSDSAKGGTTPVMAATMTPPAKNGFDSKWLMFLGAGFFTAALGLSAWAMYRLRKARETSYISRAMSRR